MKKKLEFFFHCLPLILLFYCNRHGRCTNKIISNYIYYEKGLNNYLFNPFFSPKLTSSILYIKSKVHNIAILNNIFFSFDGYFSCFATSTLRP